MDSLEEIWNQILQIIARDITPTAYNTWFADCKAVELADCKLVLHTSSDFKRGIILSRFGDTIRSALYDLFSCDFELEVLAGDEILEYTRASRRKSPYPEMDGYNFDNFIVGPSNKFAHAAAIAVANNPGRVYNPLFIYGNSGLGKTHLLLAIGERILRDHPEFKIAYLKGDEFTNELIHSIQTGTSEEFRGKYRNMDLLLMDDIQFIAGKVSTQEEVFHTFNSIYEAGHQIVLTADRPPGGDGHARRPPAHAHRGRADGRRAAAGHRDAHGDNHQQGGGAGPRPAQGRGGLHRREHHEQCTADRGRREAPHGVQGDTERQHHDRLSVKRAIKDVIRVGATTYPTPEVIIEETARYYFLQPARTCRGQRRSKNTAMARQVSMYLMRNLTNLSLVDIGMQYEGRNHSTVLSSIRKIEDMLKSDPEVAATVRDISANINSRS